MYLFFVSTHPLNISSVDWASIVVVESRAQIQNIVFHGVGNSTVLKQLVLLLSIQRLNFGSDFTVFKVQIQRSTKRKV